MTTLEIINSYQEKLFDRDMGIEVFYDKDVSQYGFIMKYARGDGNTFFKQGLTVWVAEGDDVRAKMDTAIALFNELNLAYDAISTDRRKDFESL